MKLDNAMVWWNDLEDGDDYGKTLLKILNKNDNNSEYMHLVNSSGACFANWEEIGSQRQAASLLAIVFEACARQGVSLITAHDELWKIDEYRDWHQNFEGPFAEVYRGDK